MNKKILITVMISALLVYISSCYNNKEDILSLPTISFTNDVLPIFTGDNCGCHNYSNANSSSPNEVRFTYFDTTFGTGGVVVSVARIVNTSAIIARIDTIGKWVNGLVGHPGAGIVDFTPDQKTIIKAWIAQGPPYDRGGSSCNVSGAVTYTSNILPIYNTTCKSANCHEGKGPQLTYSLLVSKQSTLTAMMNSAGASGHPGGVIGLTSCIVNTFKAWIAQGQPQ